MTDENQYAKHFDTIREYIDDALGIRDDSQSLDDSLIANYESTCHFAIKELLGKILDELWEIPIGSHEFRAVAIKNVADQLKFMEECPPVSRKRNTGGPTRGVHWTVLRIQTMVGYAFFALHTVRCHFSEQLGNGFQKWEHAYRGSLDTDKKMHPVIMQLASLIADLPQVNNSG